MKGTQAEPLGVDMLFVIPDIGGYTRFMLRHEKSPEYAQGVIRTLMEAMLRAKEIPLRVSSIEGDALFLYALRESDELWEREKATVAATIENFFVAFYAEASRLMREERCGHGACEDIGGLDIKVVVHVGRCVVDRLDRFTTLNGVDVIIAHRLLKNSLSGSYLFATRAAFEACTFPRPERFRPHAETYPDVGTIEGFVFSGD
jgi:hypothetical protein